jgi:hypothetical protein
MHASQPLSQSVVNTLGQQMTDADYQTRVGHKVN